MVMASSIWWILLAVLVIAELLSGTFYLLMLAIGAAIGGVAQFLGLSGNAQIVWAASVGLLGMGACYMYRRRFTKSPISSANPDVAQDIGAWVQVDSWLAGGRAKVQHRGAQWEAQAESVYRSGNQNADTALQPGRYRVVEVVGIRLILQA